LVLRLRDLTKDCRKTFHRMLAAIEFLIRPMRCFRPTAEVSHMNGWAVWITGLPGSGKSTIARVVARRLLQQHVRTQLLSVEMLRKVLTPSPSYTEEERDIVYGALVFVAKLLTQNKVNVIIDATANRRRYRDAGRLSISRFAEVYLKCPLQVCMKREIRRKKRSGAPSRIYLKAKTGASKTVPGVGVPYEESVSPELILDTSKLKPNECVDGVVGIIQARFV